jgi:hypothetical protein
VFHLRRALELDRLFDLFQAKGIVHPAGVLMYIDEALDYGDERGDRQQGHDALQQERTRSGAEYHLGNPQSENPFGTLSDADLAVESQAFRAGPGIRHQD